MPLPCGSLTQTFSLPLPSPPFPSWGPSPSLRPRHSLSSPLCRFPVPKAYFSRRPFCASASLPLLSTVPTSAVSRARFGFSPPDVRSSTLSGARRWVGAQGRDGRPGEMRRAFIPGAGRGQVTRKSVPRGTRRCVAGPGIESLPLSTPRISAVPARLAWLDLSFRPCP